MRSGWPEKSWPEKSTALRSRNASQGDFYATSSPARRQDDDAQRDIPAGGGERRLNGVGQAAAARYLHPHDEDGADVVPAEQLRELFAVVHGVELRTADHGDAPGKIAAVELRAGKRRAVRGNDKVRALQIGCRRAQQPDLHGPVLQGGRRAVLRGCGGRGEAHGLRAGAAARRVLRRLGGLHGGLVIGRGLALHKADGIGRAGGQAVAEPVAEMLTGQRCLAVHHGDGALVAGLRAQAAARAAFFINFNDPSDHGCYPPICVTFGWLSAVRQWPSSAHTSASPTHWRAYLHHCTQLSVSL